MKLKHVVWLIDEREMGASFQTPDTFNACPEIKWEFGSATALMMQMYTRGHRIYLYIRCTIQDKHTI